MKIRKTNKDPAQNKKRRTISKLKRKRENSDHSHIAQIMLSGRRKTGLKIMRKYLL